MPPSKMPWHIVEKYWKLTWGLKKQICSPLENHHTNHIQMASFNMIQLYFFSRRVSCLSDPRSCCLAVISWNSALLLHCSMCFSRSLAGPVQTHRILSSAALGHSTSLLRRNMASREIPYKWRFFNLIWVKHRYLWIGDDCHVGSLEDI